MARLLLLPPHVRILAPNVIIGAFQTPLKPCRNMNASDLQCFHAKNECVLKFMTF